MEHEKITDSLVINMLRQNGYIDGNFNALKKMFMYGQVVRKTAMLMRYCQGLLNVELKNLDTPNSLF